MIKGLTAATINNTFLEHVAENGLNFATTDEFEFRQAIFVSKDAENKIINSNPEHTFVVGHNFMSTWTHEEYKQLLGSKVPENLVEIPTVLDTVSVPPSIDWRTKGAVNPVKDQGQCGSCWAFSATCAIEGHNQIQHGKLISLSEQEIVDCDVQCAGCNGGWQAYAMEYVKANGQVLESDYAYTARDGTCRASSFTAQVHVATVNQVAKHSAADMRAAIAQGPMSVTVQADQSVFQRYVSGILNSSACGTSLDHAITAVGYGTEGGVNFFIVRNSWSALWGDQGYIRIATQETSHWWSPALGICGIQQVSVWPTMA